MEELLRYAIEGGSFGISLFLVYVLFKRFIIKEIVEPLDSIKTEHSKLKTSFEKFTENVTSFIFKLLKSHDDLTKTVHRDVSNMHNLFTEITKHTSQARIEAHEALKKVNVLEETTEKILKIATLVHDKNKKIETEVTKISDELILVKTKMGIKNEN